jgi:hypothetical protein
MLLYRFWTNQTGSALVYNKAIKHSEYSNGYTDAENFYECILDKNKYESEKHIITSILSTEIRNKGISSDLIHELQTEQAKQYDQLI